MGTSIFYCRFGFSVKKYVTFIQELKNTVKKIVNFVELLPPSKIKSFYCGYYFVRYVLLEIFRCFRIKKLTMYKNWIMQQFCKIQRTVFSVYTEKQDRLLHLIRWTLHSKNRLLTDKWFLSLLKDFPSKIGIRLAFKGLLFQIPSFYCQSISFSLEMKSFVVQKIYNFEDKRKQLLWYNLIRNVHKPSFDKCQYLNFKIQLWCKP